MRITPVAPSAPGWPRARAAHAPRFPTLTPENVR